MWFVSELLRQESRLNTIFCLSFKTFTAYLWALGFQNPTTRTTGLTGAFKNLTRTTGFPFFSLSSSWIILLLDRKVKIASIHKGNPPNMLTDISPYRVMGPIAVGDIIPDGQVFFLDKYKGYKSQAMSIYSIATGKKIMLFGVPGAFETTFSTKYVHAINEKADVLRSKGIQGIYCISVNDPYVMRGWELRDLKYNGSIKFLADSTGDYVESLGVDFDHWALGIRSMRFCLVVNDLKVMVASINKDFGTDIFEYISRLDV